MSTVRSYTISKTFFWRFILVLFFVFHSILFLQNGSYVMEARNIGFGLWDSYLTFFDFSNYTHLDFIVIILAIFLISYNLTLFWKFIDQQRALTIANSKKGKENNWLIGLGVFIVMIGTQCASCGAAILGGLISLSFLALFPYAGIVINIAGLLVLSYATHRLIKKINNPYVC